MLINDRFMIFSKIGSGSFGTVYKGINIDNQEYVAAKIELESSKKKRLEKESQIYTYLIENLNMRISPKMLWYGKENNFNILILSRLGLTLDKIAEISRFQLSLKTILLLTINCLKIFNKLHSLNIIHRDIKPENFAIGYSNNKNKIYIFDFGLSKIIDNNDLENKTKNSLIGTMRYASIRSHEGKELTYRDDLESLMYMIIYLYNGILPWQNINISDKENKSEAILKLKKNINLAQLCIKLPIEFREIIKYSLNLKYFEKPNYKLIINKLEDRIRYLGFEIDDQYEWLEWTDEKFVSLKTSPRSNRLSLKKTLKTININ